MDYNQALLEQARYGLALAKEKRDYSLFALICWTLKGKPYTFDNCRYMIDVLKDNCPEAYYMKSAQIFGTTIVFIWVVADALLYDRDTLYIFETDHKGAEIVKTHLNTAIVDNPILKQACSDADSVQLKKFNKAFIHIKGAKSKSSLVSVAADNVILDESDLISEKAIEGLKRRMNAEKDPILKVLSHPFYKGAGIHAEFLKGTQHEWQIKCEGCGDDRPLNFLEHVEKRGDDFVTLCPKCRKEFNRLDGGRWVAQNPNAKVISRHFSALMSPVCRFGQIFEGLHSTNPDKVEATYIYDLGLPYTSSTVGLNIDDIKQVSVIKRKFPFGRFMAVDPGAVFHYLIFDLEEDKIKVNDYGSVSGFGELSNLVNIANVHGGIIDALPELDGARKWCESNRGWFTCQIEGAKLDGLDFRPDGQNRLHIHANRSRMHDKVLSNYRSGKILLPLEAGTRTNSEIMIHLTSPRRRVERDLKGGVKIIWEETPGKPDHLFSCSIFASIFQEINQHAGSVAQNIGSI